MTTTTGAAPMTANITKGTAMLHTTLTILRKHNACERGYKTLKASLPQDHAADAPITLAHILKSNGIGDALWALRTTVEPTGRNVAQEIAIRAAERALPIFEKHRPDDNRVRECIAATRAFLCGEISHDDLLQKRRAAHAAADAAHAANAYAAASAAYAAYAYAAAYAAYAADAAHAANAYAASYAAYAAAAYAAYAYAASYAAYAADAHADYYAASKAEREAQARDLLELLGVSA